MNARGHRWGGILVVSTVATVGYLVDVIQVSVLSAGAVTLALASAYSLGSVPDTLERTMGAEHRNPITHSLPFALFVGFGAFGIVYVLLLPVRTVFDGLVAQITWVVHTLIAGYIGILVSAVVSLHVLFDIASKGGGFRIQPFGPTIEKTLALGFYTVRTGKADDIAKTLGRVSVIGLAVSVLDESVLNEQIQSHITEVMETGLVWVARYLQATYVGV